MGGEGLKIVIRVVNIVLYILVLLVLIASVGSAMVKQPVLLSVVRSYSMYPLLTRGDMVIVGGLGKTGEIETGDVILFKAEEGSLSSAGWVVHRIVEGNPEDGYITKGDNNESSDQESGSVRIKREWIASRVLTMTGLPVKIPLIGYIPLWAEGFQKNTYALPIIAVILAGIIGISELLPKKRRRLRQNPLEMPLIYFFGGLTLSVILAASMLVTSQSLTLVYEVSESSQGAIMGSAVGIMKVGEEIEKPLATLGNKTIFPIIATCTSLDSQVSFSHTRLSLRKGQAIKATFRVTAQTPGQYRSPMWVGMFFPFLPSGVIYALAKVSFWLALVVVALIPGLPIMLYPLFDAKLRGQTRRGIRRSWRQFRRRLPL